MGEKIVVGPIDKGLRNDRTPFVIDNDSFPTLINAYQWRGRVKRKRGTSFLNRLTRYFNSTSTAYSTTSTIALSGGAANILTGFSLQTKGNVVPGSVTIVDTTASVTYTDPAKDGTLSGGSGGSINYATGAITITGGAAHTISAALLYYPDLPVMGLEDLVLSASQFPGTLGFDTVYSYNINTTFPYSIYDVSFYKNPPTSGAYTEKTTVTSTNWNGQDYQQVWTVNYEGALWATNGINVPFSSTNVGMQYAVSSSITYVSNTATNLVVTITGSPLVVGDFVFVNEWTGANAASLNFQSGFVTLIAGANITITFPNATLGAGPYSPGIIQYLTNRSDPTKDCLRWYDGDPTDGNATTPTLNGHKGWVNFAPPLLSGANDTFIIDDVPAGQYYLVGARIIFPFKDRLLFFGPVIQTSSPNSQVYLQDTIIFSQNGTPYYTASFTGSPTSGTTVYHPILVPTNQTATANSYFEDISGYGGYFAAGYAQPITTVNPNQDVLIVGFSNRQAKLIYTGNDLLPFSLFIINSEYGSSNPFAAITMDRGANTIGERGIVLTSQIESQRTDIEIPDQVFEFNLLSNGTERLTAQRDFVEEWIYFTYPSNEFEWKFPNQTLQYNYRDASWAIFNETYTTYGQFRRATGLTWATIGDRYPTWSVWDTTWNSGSSTLLQPKVIAGNQQGFVLFREDDTGEGNSLYITSFSGSTVTAPDHCLNNGDYIVISGCIGTIGAEVNGNIYSISGATQNTFLLNPTLPSGSPTYFGGGVIKRMYVPQIQTKQFPSAWGLARKTRIGTQQYLFTTTSNGQITLQIFLSQNSSSPYNFGPIIPAVNSENDSLIYSSILYTCPENTNLGLTPANINLNMVTALQQSQIWHRMNTSLLGDTVQIGFTLSDSQMRDTTFSNQFTEIELHGFILDVSPSQVLA